jgi:hypothetical protein
LTPTKVESGVIIVIDILLVSLQVFKILKQRF